MPQKSMLKTLINIILAKLCIKIYNIKINLELNEYESVFEFKVDNVLYGDVNIQKVDLERKLSIKGFEVNVHTFFNDKFSSQMFMSAVESVHGETNENGNHSTYRVLKCLDEITLKAKDNDYPQIDVDFGRIRSIICPSTVSAFLQLINELPEKTPTTISPNDNQSLFNLTNFKVFIQSIDVLILFNEPSEIPNGNDFWLSSNDYNLSDFHLYFHFNNIYINTKPSFELEVGDSSIMAIDKNKKLPILVFDEMIGESIRNDNDKRMSDWLNEDDHVNLFDKTSWHLLDSNNQTKKPEVTLSASNNIVNISPIHVFIDLMIVETFFNSDLFKSLDCLSTNNSEATYQSAINTLLDESFKNDYGNDRSHLKISDVLNPTTRIPFELLINAIRISVRCPPPTESNKLRSGILVIDGESLKITPKSQPSFSSTTISLKSVNVYWLDTQVNDRKLLKIAMIKDEEIESSLEILKRISLPPVLKFNLPFISFRFSRSTVIGLQYLADDLTKFGERIRKLTDKKEDLIGSTIEMIKSRLIVNEKEKGEDVDVENMEDFFDFNDKDNENKYLNHNLENADVEVDLKNGVYSIEVPTIDHEGKTQEDIVTLVAKAKDLKLHAKFGINDHHSKDETRIKILISIIDIFKHSSTNSEHLLQSKKYDNLPCLHVLFTSNLISNNQKVSNADLLVHSLIIKSDLNVKIFNNLFKVFESPPDVFENAVPSEVTKVDVKFKDVSTLVYSPKSERRLATNFNSCNFKLFLSLNKGLNDVKFVAGSISIYVLDNEHEALLRRKENKQPSNIDKVDSLVEYWRSLDYVQIIEAFRLSGILKIADKSLPRIVADLKYADVRVGICPDTLATMMKLMNDFSFNNDQNDDQNDSNEVDKTYENVLESLDEDAFKIMPDIAANADMMNDDIPSNQEYIYENTTQQKEAWIRERIVDFDAFEEGLSPSISDIHYEEDDQADYVITAPNESDEVIKKFDNETTIQYNYFDELQNKLDNKINDLPSMIELKLSNADVSLQLFGGYDWVSTREAVEKEHEKLRKKLIKIRQLLATGQKASDDSHYNEILDYVDDVDTANDEDLIKAIDKRLENDNEHDNNEDDNEWQNIEVKRTFDNNNKQRPTDYHTSINYKKSLLRSTSPIIEITACGVNGKYIKFNSENDDCLNDNLHLNLRDIEIFDKLKTSSWNKFLTPLRSDLHGISRETNSNMVAIKVENFGNKVNKDEELKVKVKVLPLKLNIDQDALEFMKNFMSFRVTKSDEDNVTLGEPKGPYLREVVIDPVEIKMDYKPKHVNYRALKAGRTIELMNFFHFDGSEIILRKVVVSGIIGWSRLFDLLQDTWTPDVKANQLSDIISGVSPIKSIVNVGTGFADLLLLPIEQYKEDKRLLRGLQKGGQSFTKNAGMEALRMGSKLATGTQVILEYAESLLSGSSSSTSSYDKSDIVDNKNSELISKYAHQPSNLKEGISTAYKSLGDNVNSAAQTILAVPMEIFERNDNDEDASATKAVVKAVPIAVLKPLIGVSEAASKIQQGLIHTLSDPNLMNDLKDKYK